MSAPAIYRTIWPWHSAPADCDDYDAAIWHAIRQGSNSQLPRQSLDRWVLEQRARRSRDVMQPPLLREVEHEQLRVDLIAFWNDPRLDPAALEAQRPRWIGGRLVGGSQ